MMLAYVFAFDVDKFSVVVLDQDRTDLSRRYIADLSGDGTFEIAAYLESYDEIEPLLQAGRARVAIVIPHGTTGQIAGRSVPAEVQAVIDGVDSIYGAAGRLAVGTAQPHLLAEDCCRRPALALDRFASTPA